MTDKTYTEPVTVLMTREEKCRLKEIAEAKGLTVSGLIRMILREHLKEESR